MTILCEIARKWYTDKTKTTENVYSHNYTPYYHELLKEKRNASKVLEIGLGWSGLMHSNYRCGGSLFMWQDYFPEAQIYGLDIRADTLVNEDRIRSFQCDQGDGLSLKRSAELIGCDFDLIVDDGSHIPEHQVLTAKAFVSLLAPGGIYVIEDVHTPELQSVLDNLGFRYEVIEVENKTLSDDRLIVIRKDEQAARTSRAVVNVSFGGYYQHAQRRLARTVAQLDPETSLRLYDGIPSNWPSHTDKPYSFKAFALKEAAEQYDLVLWCDSSIMAIRSMEPLWRRIEHTGYFLVYGGPSSYIWTADSAYPDLFKGMPIEEARTLNRKIPYIVGGIIGLNVRSKIGSQFLDEYYRLAKDTNAFRGPWANLNCPKRPQYGEGGQYTTYICGPPDVMGHRHDQTAASIIAYRLGMELTEYPVPYSRNETLSDTSDKGTILLHDGPGLALNDTPGPAPVSALQETIKPKGQICPKCRSTAIGMAGGMRNCNQCGDRW